MARPSARSSNGSRATSWPGSDSAWGSPTPSTPDALVEAAARLDFPVFEVPYDVPFIAVTEKAFSHLVNEQYAILQRALSAHERLERIVLSEQGLEGVTRALAELVGGTAIVYDARGETLALSDGAEPLAPEVLAANAAEVREHARARARRGYAPTGGSPDGGRSRCRWSAPRRAQTAWGRRPRRGWWPSRTRAGCASSTASCRTRP